MKYKMKYRIKLNKYKYKLQKMSLKLNKYQDKHKATFHKAVILNSNNKLVFFKSDINRFKACKII